MMEVSFSITCHKHTLVSFEDMDLSDSRESFPAPWRMSSLIASGNIVLLHGERIWNALLCRTCNSRPNFGELFIALPRAGAAATLLPVPFFCDGAAQNTAQHHLAPVQVDL